MNPYCGDDVGKTGSRDLCRKCYVAANNYRISRGKTWADLEAEGKCGPAGVGRKRDPKYAWLVEGK